jgi:hypothetical protein
MIPVSIQRLDIAIILTLLKTELQGKGIFWIDG